MARYRIVKKAGSGYYIPQKSNFPFVWKNLHCGDEGFDSLEAAKEVVRMEVWSEVNRRSFSTDSVIWEAHEDDLAPHSDPARVALEKAYRPAPPSKEDGVEEFAKRAEAFTDGVEYRKAPTPSMLLESGSGQKTEELLNRADESLKKLEAMAERNREKLRKLSQVPSATPVPPGDE